MTNQLVNYSRNTYYVSTMRNENVYKFHGLPVSISGLVVDSSAYYSSINISQSSYLTLKLLQRIRERSQLHGIRITPQMTTPVNSFIYTLLCEYKLEFMDGRTIILPRVMHQVDSILPGYLPNEFAVKQALNIQMYIYCYDTTNDMTSDIVSNRYLSTVAMGADEVDEMLPVFTGGCEYFQGLLDAPGNQRVTNLIDDVLRNGYSPLTIALDNMEVRNG